MSGDHPTNISIILENGYRYEVQYRIVPRVSDGTSESTRADMNNSINLAQKEENIALINLKNAINEYMRVYTASTDKSSTDKSSTDTVFSCALKYMNALSHTYDAQHNFEDANPSETKHSEEKKVVYTKVNQIIYPQSPMVLKYVIITALKAYIDTLKTSSSGGRRSRKTSSPKRPPENALQDRNHGPITPR